MCIAIYKKPESVIEHETLERCYKANPDGCGFAFINGDGELEIFKTLDFEAFYLAYKECLTENPTSPFLIHFRIKTHGPVNEYNCHPFKIDNEHVFIHNGIISRAPLCSESAKSDTQMFNEHVLQKLPEGWIHSEAICELLGAYIDFSKLVILNRQGVVRIINEEKGVWEDGVWYSNTSFRPREVYTALSQNVTSRWTRGVKEMWDFDNKCWREVDFMGKFIGDSKPKAVGGHSISVRCEICSYLYASQVMWRLRPIGEAETLSICPECKTDLEDMGDKWVYATKFM